MYGKALIAVLFAVILIALSQIVAPSGLMYPLVTLPNNVIDLPAINFTSGLGTNSYVTVKPQWQISLVGSGEFTYDVLGYCVIYFYNGSATVLPYNSFNITFLSHMDPRQISKAYYWTYYYPGYEYSSYEVVNITSVYGIHIDVPAQTLVICYYTTRLTQSELKDVILATFKDASVAVLNSGKVYYYYANNGTYAEFVDVIGSHIIVVINYPSKDKGNDIMYYYKDPVNILLQLTYDVNNYMKGASNSGPLNF
ncbi:hypothetical protein KN1_11960 [Stygiolobus caldivivus]|uniref:Uncharacterized protein n=2 Tax=Stygiolobus caldivivus TaxID=2824673 RepID=A0A8D5ZHQ1_9CREN|nr:hypothetical protein KN1_11960 [Stygiolobus caldivivus]